MRISVQEYIREDGSNPYKSWFDGLDSQAIERVVWMALTRDFRQTVIERVQRDPEFARALLDEAATLFLNGEPEAARIILRDLANATVGFEELAAMTSKPSKSLHRMLSSRGNPSMDNLAAIFSAIRRKLKVEIEVRAVEKAS